MTKWGSVIPGPHRSSSHLYLNMIGIDKRPTLGSHEDCYVLVTVNPLAGELVRSPRLIATRVPRARAGTGVDAHLNRRYMARTWRSLATLGEDPRHKSGRGRDGNVWNCYRAPTPSRPEADRPGWDQLQTVTWPFQ